MLYKKNAEAKLSGELFKNPSSEYRGAPFWAWNCKLEGPELLRQIDIFKEMGLGGFHMHSRTGLGTPYMGDEFLSLVELCNKKAKENEMLCFLYDEDRWPSGAAGGLVTRDHKYRERFLCFCPYGHDFDAVEYPPGSRYVPRGERKLMGRYRVQLKDGFLDKYEILPLDKPPSDTTGVWEAYLDYVEDSPWFNDEGYLDTLSKEAVDRFIEETHEPYRKRLGADFGGSVPAIFTDEPQFWAKDNFTRSDTAQVVTVPFADDFEDSYKKVYGESFLDYLPELFWEFKSGFSKARYRYHDHVCERFTVAFIDNVGEWCEKNGIMLTGHMMSEESLYFQTRLVGEAMRGYRYMQLPGIDMLCDRREYTTAKQCQSATRQYGREGVLSEIYGVTGWDFDFRGHKLQGDWQAALGVTLRVHHLTWVTMEGEAKRDYPACIGYQSPWYTEYSYVEDHFARLNTALTRGKPVVRVALVHPVEGFWLRFGPNDKTSQARSEMEKEFADVIEWLLFGQIDFDFIAESLLPDLYNKTADGKFAIGEMAYNAVVVPNCLSLRNSTLNALNDFQTAGGKVIFAGEPASVVEGVLSDAAVALSRKCLNVPFAKTHILDVLEDYRDITVSGSDGGRAEHFLYQLRQDNDCHWLFLCNGTKPDNEDLPKQEKYTISIKGLYAPLLYNTLDGSVTEIRPRHQEGNTIIETTMHMHDSLLLKLLPAEALADVSEAKGTIGPDRDPGDDIDIPISSSGFCEIEDPYAFELSEPNVLVLDMAEYAFNGGEWQAKEEILRIDNIFRERLGYPLRMQSLAQPWTLGEQPESGNVLNLRFKVFSEIAMDEVELALENREGTEVIWNGQLLEGKTEGYYVDRSIKKLSLPSLKAGDNELILNIKFEKRTNVENCFLLGKFGLKLAGANAYITEYPKKLSFGDLTKQGLPFYGGNLTYKCRVYSKGGVTQLEASYFRTPVLKVKLAGKDVGYIAYAPYTISLGNLPEGWHDIEICSYGNRVNTFGALHNCDEKIRWMGPNAWRTVDYDWSYEYVIMPTGILKAPRIRILSCS